jgi:hypothetical protein
MVLFPEMSPDGRSRRGDPPSNIDAILERFTEARQRLRAFMVEMERIVAMRRGAGPTEKRDRPSSAAPRTPDPT